MGGRSITARRLATAAVVSALVLGACSSDDDDSGSTSAPAETSAVTEPAETQPAETSPPGDPGFVFGYLAPAPGLLADLATAQQAALELAVGDINDAGGVNGAPVKVVSVDEPADGNVANAINELLDQGADMILGPVGSTSATDAMSTIDASGTVACSASATATSLTDLDTTDSFFRTAMPDPFTTAYVADQIAADAAATTLPEGQPYRVSILARADEYGVNVGNTLASMLTAQGIEVDVVSYNPRRVIFDAEAAQIVGFAPNTVVLVAYSEAVRQVSTLVGAGISPDQILGLDATFDPRFASRAFPDDATRADGMRVIGATGGRAFIDRLLDSSPVDQVIYGAQMYDCAVVGALAATVAKSPEPAAYRSQMRPVTADGRPCSTYADCVASIDAGDEIDYTGVSGGIRFDANGDPTEVRITIASFQDAELTELSSTDLNLDDIRQQEAMAAAIFTTRVQQLLAALGFYTGPIDGQWSDELTAAVGALQTELGVPVTGVWDAETDAAARARYGAVTGLLGESVADLQQLLTDLGFYTGPIDGIWSADVTAAIRALQRALGVPETGILDAATLRAAYLQGIITGTPESTTTTEPAAETTPAPTAPPPTPAPTAPPAPPTTPPPAPPTTPPPAPECTGWNPNPDWSTVGELMQADPEQRFTVFLELLSADGFDASTLDPFTVFAPTDDALARAGITADYFDGDPDGLRAFLAVHAIEEPCTLDDLASVDDVTTLHGVTLAVTDEGGTVLISAQPTIAPDEQGRNGVLIPLDGVIPVP